MSRPRGRPRKNPVELEETVSADELMGRSIVKKEEIVAPIVEPHPKKAEKPIDDDIDVAAEVHSQWSTWLAGIMKDFPGVDWPSVLKNNPPPASMSSRLLDDPENMSLAEIATELVRVVRMRVRDNSLDGHILSAIQAAGDK